METKKLKRKLHGIETQDKEGTLGFCLKGTKDSASKMKGKKKTAMTLGSRKRRIPKTSRSVKSKSKQGHSGSSKKSGSMVRKRTKYTDVYDDVEAKFSVMERADHVLTRLENDLPHFLKCMLPSNVSHGFWLHLPRKFCSLHLPDHDTCIVLVDEWGNEYSTSYLLERHGLSAGWRGFSMSHRLLPGDILIFHLTQPCKLQVHIVRVNGWDVIDAALCLMNLDAFETRPHHAADVVRKKDERRRKRTKYAISTPSNDFEANWITGLVVARQRAAMKFQMSSSAPALAIRV